MTAFDVVVVGSGNAGLCAALAARESGASVCLVEKAPPEWVGGNSFCTAGAYRTTYAGLDDLTSLATIDDATASLIRLPAYLPSDFYDDLVRVTNGRTDVELARTLVSEAADGAEWLSRYGVRWDLLIERQSHMRDGQIRFWGNLVIGSSGGGAGLIQSELAAARRAGVELIFDSPMIDFHWKDQLVDGIICETKGRPRHVEARATVLASGGFEADSKLRAKYLGEGWDLARVRGTPHNTGEVLFMALDQGALPWGQWSGCHSIAWDAEAPPFGDRDISNRFSRQAYPYGVLVNGRGERFLDEGADFRNYTYARYGADILRQPGGLAFQLFDSQTLPYVSAVDYSTATQSRRTDTDLLALARNVGINDQALRTTIDEFNASIVRAGPLDPSVKDGNRTVGIDPPKSNWAVPLTEPPFTSFAVTCGITFTFGGLRIQPSGQVLRGDGGLFPGLFACGEIVGGLFHDNYPGGAGLAAGTVFGRRAGVSAAHFARVAAMTS